MSRITAGVGSAVAALFVAALVGLFVHGSGESHTKLGTSVSGATSTTSGGPGTTASAPPTSSTPATTTAPAPTSPPPASPAAPGTVGASGSGMTTGGAVGAARSAPLAMTGTTWRLGPAGGALAAALVLRRRVRLRPNR